MHIVEHVENRSAEVERNGRRLVPVFFSVTISSSSVDLLGVLL
jgi:hypothetical protein